MKNTLKKVSVLASMLMAFSVSANYNGKGGQRFYFRPKPKTKTVVRRVEVRKAIAVRPVKTTVKDVVFQQAPVLLASAAGIPASVVRAPASVSVNQHSVNQHRTEPSREPVETPPAHIVKSSLTGQRLTVRRSPAQVRNAGVTSMFNLPKFDGVGFSFGKEQVFENNSNMMKTSSYKSSGQSGQDFLRTLKNYTASKGCIPNLMIAGHGWGADGKKRDSIATGSTSRDNNRGLYVDGEGVTIKGDLARLIQSGEVQFCKSCQIFMHACSISDTFSSALVKTTGCSVVSADYKVSPIDTNTGVYDHVWFTSAGGKFSKYTPNQDGTVSRKIIGEEFIFDPR